MRRPGSKLHALEFPARGGRHVCHAQSLLAQPVAKAPIKAGDHLILVDGSGFIFRAFHALPPLTRKSDGLPTGAVLGFCNMVWKMLQEGPTPEPGDEPTHFAVIFDYSAKIVPQRDLSPTTRRTGPSRPPT